MRYPTPEQTFMTDDSGEIFAAAIDEAGNIIAISDALHYSQVDAGDAILGAYETTPCVAEDLPLPMRRWEP